ncbi:F-box protein CPR1-like [Papaver somniferum]|uniref:F-box protein CPR1-like n=1 Tax=Papaver somniferum TaxID=3469 RepID=UPI000E6F618C|nr:F-box protein CPR1-like [Papaver somniferum]
MSSIPQALWFEILSRVPVETTFVFLSEGHDTVLASTGVYTVVSDVPYKYSNSYVTLLGSSKAIHAPGDGSAIHVFRLREKLWSTQTICYNIHPSNDEVLLIGAFHWVCNMRGSAGQFILSWDIHLEVFKEVPLPKINWGQSLVLLDIGIMDLYLCALVRVPTSQIQVWVMHEYGAGNSWCQRYIITNDTIVNHPSFAMGYAYSYTMKVACIFKSGEILFWAESFI